MDLADRAGGSQLGLVHNVMHTGERLPLVATGVLIDHGMSIDMLDRPAGRRQLTPITSKGHHTWEPEECARFEAHHASSVGTEWKT